MKITSAMGDDTKSVFLHEVPVMWFKSFKNGITNTVNFKHNTIFSLDRLQSGTDLS